MPKHIPLPEYQLEQGGELCPHPKSQLEDENDVNGTSQHHHTHRTTTVYGRDEGTNSIPTPTM